MGRLIMQTVFSHIIQKRFSQVNEDVATDALTFILNSSEPARNGMIKLLRGIDTNIPDLRFQAQQTEGSIRPDLWGLDATEPHVYIENKFWAGLTDNQPIPYLKQLAEYPQPTILLVIVPEAREQTMRRELIDRLNKAEIRITFEDTAESHVFNSFTTEIGPKLAITSWTKLLSILELEVADDPSARSDLLQLRALCESADSNAFIPISDVEISDQRTPAFILQINSIIQAAVDSAVTKEILKIDNTRPQADWKRIGRYVYFAGEKAPGIWIGIHFDLWKKHGGTPIWLIFSSDKFSQVQSVRPLLEPWATRESIFTCFQNNELAVAIDLPTGEEKEYVVKSIVDFLKRIKDVLSELKPDSSKAYL